MSGFEIAGVVLAGFPILVNSAELVKNTFQKSIDWWHFEIKLNDFLAEVEREQVVYRQVLKLLLSGAPIGDEECRDLVYEPSHFLWTQRRIYEAIESKFDQHEKRYIEGRLENLRDSVQGLGELIPDVKELSERKDFFEKELIRLKFSFSSEAPDLLGHVSRTNTELHKFLRRTSMPQRNPTSHLHRELISLGGYHAQVKSFSQALVECWKCDCIGAHEFGITAKRPANKCSVQSGYSSLQILFREESTQALLRLQPPKTSSRTDISDESEAAPAEIRHGSRQDCRSNQQTESESPPAKKRRVSERLREKFAELAQLRRRRSRGQPEIPSLTQENDEAVRLQRLRLQGPANPDSNTTTLVTDVCKLSASLVVPSGAYKEPCSVFIGSKEKAILRRTSEEQRDLDGKKARTLAATISEPRLTRFQRVSVGIRLVETLLILATSPWTPESLYGDENLILVDLGNQRCVRPLGPYICRRSVPDLASKEVQREARPSLLLLAITILELYHGCRIEKQPTWGQTLNEGNEGLDEATVWVLSAWRWLQCSERALKEQYGEGMGGRLHNALKKCIRFDFENRQAFWSIELAEKVYQKVFMPLEDCMPEDLWDGISAMNTYRNTL